MSLKIRKSTKCKQEIIKTECIEEFTSASDRKSQAAGGSVVGWV
jgi:hypothetical protein